MIFNDDVGMLLLDHPGELTEECRLSDTCHILQADFLSTGLYLLIGQTTVVFEGMNGRGGDAKRALRGHACFFGPTDRRRDIADIIQSVEDTGNVNTLGVLHLIHHATHVVGHGIHAKGIQTTVEHMGLDAHLIERFTECTNGFVGILAGKQVHLLKGTAIGFYSGETPHFNDGRGDALQLILAGLELAAALPHIPVNETELNLFFHILDKILICVCNSVFVDPPPIGIRPDKYGLQN